MSNDITNLCRPLQLRPTPKCVLMALADRADDNGIAWPSITWICTWTCFGRTAVIEAVKWLEQEGIVSVSKEIGRSNQCAICLPQVRRLVADQRVPRAGQDPVDELARHLDPSGSRTGTRPGGGLDHPRTGLATLLAGGPNQSGSRTGDSGPDGSAVDAHQALTSPGDVLVPSGRRTSPAGEPVREPDYHPSGSRTPPVREADGTRPGGGPYTSNTSNTSEETNTPPTPKGGGRVSSDKPGTVPDGFPEFWAEYPRKDSKADAVKAWRQVGLHAHPAQRVPVMAGLKAWKSVDQWTKDKGQFIPLPATWLRKMRWTDETVAGAVRLVQAANARAPWWQVAGFDHPAHAENHRCYAHNADQFRDGRRIEEPAT